MIASVLQQMNLEYLGATSTVLFFAVFVAIAFRTFRTPDREELARQAALPIDDGDTNSTKE